MAGLLSQIAYSGRHFLCASTQSTTAVAASPQSLCVHDFKLARAQYLRVKLRAYLESSNGIGIAALDLYRLDGASLNTTVSGSVFATTSLVSGVLFEADLTSALLGTYDGAIEGRLWVSGAGAAICRGAWIDYE